MALLDSLNSCDDVVKRASILSIHALSLVGETSCKRTSEEIGGLGVGLAFFCFWVLHFVPGPSFSVVLLNALRLLHQ